MEGGPYQVTDSQSDAIDRTAESIGASVYTGY